MAQDQNESSPQHSPEQSDRQLKSLISLFNWLVGEVITARVMILRLAGDMVRTGVLTVEEINGTPLTQDIIDSVMSNFPTDPMWQALGQRLRTSLDALRQMDLENELDPEDGEDDALDDDFDDEFDTAEEDPAQVIYRSPGHDDAPKRMSLFPRPSRVPGKQN